MAIKILFELLNRNYFEILTFSFFVNPSRYGEEDFRRDEKMLRI